MSHEYDDGTEASERALREAMSDGDVFTEREVVLAANLSKALDEQHHLRALADRHASEVGLYARRMGEAQLARVVMRRERDEARAEVERLRVAADAARALYDEAVEDSRPRTGVQHNGRRMSPSARQAIIRALGPVFDEEPTDG